MVHNAQTRRKKRAAKVLEINEKLAQIEATPLHTKEILYTVQHTSIGQLRALFSHKQSPIHDQDLASYYNNEFIRFSSNPETTLIIKGNDGGIIACRSSLKDNSILNNISTSLKDLPQYKTTPTNHSATRRGQYPYRHYCVWSPYSKTPFLSKEFRLDGTPAELFMNNGDALWEEMSTLLGRYFKGTYKEFMRHSLPNGLKRMAGVWMGVVINIGQENAPVETEAHQDVQESKNGFSCLCPFGEYVGGALILWELHYIVELQPGEIFIFPDAIIHHSNEPVTGTRHSIVAITQQNMLDYFIRKYQLKNLPNKRWRPSNKIVKSKQEIKHEKWLRKEQVKARFIPSSNQEKRKPTIQHKKASRKQRQKEKCK